MSDKKSMSIDEFSLLVCAVHREFVKNPICVSITGSSIFYSGANGGPHIAHIFDAGSHFWPTIKGVDFRYSKPSLWSFKERREYKKLIGMLNEMRGYTRETEALICDNIPCAKDIIAEKALVEDGD